uniref:Exostosin GT47 domain-containing protein n=1 Tax=Fagus sylvatica TaxID=28930 RepID=A0A2N9FH50_FAGSY
MGERWTQFARLIVTQQGQCASVEKAQNTQIVQWQRRVGLKLPSEPGAPMLTDWTKADLDNIFTTNDSRRGWCNVDPAEVYASKVQFKEECYCKYDCLWGWFCEVPVLCTCINQCSGHGHCRGGFCQINVPDNAHLTGKVSNLNAMVKKRRPLIYVYDLPPEFNSLLLEVKISCNLIYDGKNATSWTDQLYGAQEHMELRSYFTLEFYKKAYDHIVQQYPYWNRSSGKDHIWFFSWDEGACYAPKEIWNSMMLVHWGNTNSKYNHSTTSYWADNWDDIPSNRRGSHPCFDPDKDLVLPAWKRPDINALSSKLWARSREKRKTLFYFNRNLGPAYPKNRLSASMGIRQKIAEEFGSSPNKEGKLGKQHAEDVIVTPLRSKNYHEDLASSVFCGVLPGDGWSGHMEDSILQGCIPVIIQDGIFLPYENVLDYENFAVRIREDEIPNLIKILRGFNETEIEYKPANVRKIWQRFLYRDSVVLEADRQKTGFGHVKDWAVEFLQLIEDDVFATFVQLCFFLWKIQR